MREYSVFNDVLGPVMRGPSSSHTAASHRIGRLARDLSGAEARSASFLFDARGSYGRVYQEQGSDLAFAAGLLGWSMTDDRFFEVLGRAEEQGLEISFNLGDLPEADHPNEVQIRLTGPDQRQISILAKSVGGGSVRIERINHWPVQMTGEAYEVLIESSRTAEEAVRQYLGDEAPLVRQERGDLVFYHASRRTGLSPEIETALAALPGVTLFRVVDPVFFVRQGEAPAADAGEMLSLAEEKGWSLGRAAWVYEARLLGMSENEAFSEMARRWQIMKESVATGLEGMKNLPLMQFLQPTAHKVILAESEGRLSLGGPHTRAAARALAVMHVNSRMGLICAAPTGGSCGVIPAVLTTAAEELQLLEKRILMALWAAAGIGLIFLMHGRTFAAEVAGCQVEIGAAGAMAAAAVVEAAGGSAGQACEAAAIALQNTMGLPCDLVQGVVELPCHTRNAAAASNAFICADLILGGYANPIPLAETIEASLETGRALPAELRCTSLGGLSVTPAALKLPRNR